MSQWLYLADGFLGCSWNVLWHWQSGTGGRRLEWMPDAKSDALRCSCSRDSSRTLWWRVRGAEGSPEFPPGHLTTQLTNRSNTTETWCLEVNLPFFCPAGCLIVSRSRVGRCTKNYIMVEFGHNVPADQISQKLHNNAQQQKHNIVCNNNSSVWCLSGFESVKRNSEIIDHRRNLFLFVSVKHKLLM